MAWEHLWRWTGKARFSRPFGRVGAPVGVDRMALTLSFFSDIITIYYNGEE